MPTIKLTDLVVEIQYNEFTSFVNQYKLDEEFNVISEIVIPPRLKKIWGFIKNIAEKISLKIFSPSSVKYTCFILVSFSSLLNSIALISTKSFRTLFKLCFVTLSFLSKFEIVIPSYKDMR